MPKGKLYHLPKEMTQKPGYPSGDSKGSSSPEGYQREARGHSPSPAGTKGAAPGSRKKM